MPCKCRRELASRRHKRSACIIWPGEHHLWGDSQRPLGEARGGEKGWGKGGGGWRGERRREEQRVQNNRWELSGKWKENEVQCWGGGKWWNEQDGHHRREQGNNTEAIRENGGIISPCSIISTDSSIMHNLHRFHNTPCPNSGPIIKQVAFSWFACVDVHGRKGAIVQKNSPFLYSVPPEPLRLMVFLPLKRCRQLGRGHIIPVLCLSIYSNSLHWPD